MYIVFCVERERERSRSRDLMFDKNSFKKAQQKYVNSLTIDSTNDLRSLKILSMDLLGENL